MFRRTAPGGSQSDKRSRRYRTRLQLRETMPENPGIVQKCDQPYGPRRKWWRGLKRRLPLRFVMREENVHDSENPNGNLDFKTIVTSRQSYTLMRVKSLRASVGDIASPVLCRGQPSPSSCPIRSGCAPRRTAHPQWATEPYHMGSGCQHLYPLITAL